ncbi:TPA: hypothetical protein U1266_000723 [Streptococcus suis]|nr:hypothetical protein [Streptococcus suis]HEM5073934.1 hypothetical protein [Streptococcus suis]HEM5094916.1 hypothetical protein [Streptococcus suis]HEM5143442.1 hypothetical protein [Streptococcus suis]HEM5151912.1 hypothetical protein [Streptococcus suis]
MYFGHYALATAVKAKEPDLSVLPIFLATGAIDIMNGLFIMTGVDKVTPNLDTKPYLYFDLTYIDWDHSLLMGIVWSIAAAFIAYWAYKKDRRIGVATGLVAFSHWLLDLPLHNGDMALYPGSSIKLGWGWWRTLGEYGWHLEVAFSIVLLIYAYHISKKRGENIWPQLVFLALLTINMSPWLSPMKIVATFPEPWAHLVHGFLVCVGFIIPGFIFAWLYKKTSKRASLKA